MRSDCDVGRYYLVLFAITHPKVVVFLRFSLSDLKAIWYLKVFSKLPCRNFSTSAHYARQHPSTSLWDFTWPFVPSSFQFSIIIPMVDCKMFNGEKTLRLDLCTDIVQSWYHSEILWVPRSNPFFHKGLRIQSVSFCAGFYAPLAMEY